MTEKRLSARQFAAISAPHDTLIAGAGLIGSSIAWLLARAGFRVILIDAAKFGNEASAAGAGMLAPGGEYRESSPAAQFALQSLALYPTFVQTLEKESGISIDFRKCGAVELAYEHEHWESLKCLADLQQRFGISVESICTSTLHELAPGLNLGGLRGALYYPHDSCVAPQDLLKALKIACERRGVTILEDTPVTSIHAEPNGVVAVTEDGWIKTRSAVVAAGAWSSQIAIRHADVLVEIPGTFPVKGHIISYQLPPCSLRPILRYGHHYVLQRNAGFTLAGSSEERCGFDRSLNLEAIRNIHAATCSFYAPLLTVRPIREWIGFRPGTAENDPVITRVPDTNVWLAYGHYRNGILLTPATAYFLADEILSEISEGQGHSSDELSSIRI